MRTKLWHRSYRERTARISGPDTPYSRKNPHRRDTVEYLLQVHKTHVDWLGKHPCTLEDPAKGVQLVHCSTPRTKTTLLLLNPRVESTTTDVAIPSDNNIRKKEHEKLEKYQGLKEEIERMWVMKATVVPVVIGTLVAVTPKLSR
ncbi:hypothetical protein D4764_15G0003390 [Takifugu flavidus]|uniref:Uncharacterized protein n=1 Tax=Takifugu flavidus TaxID=433684 RepID=A0A5C6P0W7_9TELE|nr:hypothetical protein D4764_15G0003390 [Takifugu flavidus]